MVRRPILLSFLLSFTHLFCTTDFLSGKNTITLKNGKPLAHDSGGKKKVKLKKGVKTMASSVALKNRESKSKKRIMNRKPLALVLKIEKVGPWVSCVTEIIVAERKKNV